MATKKTVTKATETKTNKKSATKTEKVEGGFMRLLTLSPELAAVIGKESVPRTTIVKKIWTYIKENNLQDPKDKKVILPDAKLSKVFTDNENNPIKRVGMFEVSKHISKHVK